MVKIFMLWLHELDAYCPGKRSRKEDLHAARMDLLRYSHDFPFIILSTVIEPKNKEQRQTR